VPWASFNGAEDFGPAGANVADAAQIAWFDHWLKGRPLDGAAQPVRYFLMGANRWRESKTWPPEGAATRELFLHSYGRAGSASGDGLLSETAPEAETPDVFIFDPGEPVESIGGASCCRAGVTPVGAYDQRPIETRNDVLVFTTEAFADDVDVVGPVELILFAATDAPDTDWTSKLVDVHPNGRAINLCDGLLRASYAKSLEVRTPPEPGTINEYRIILGSTANRFRRGHRLRLEVSSSSFPAYDVNPNTGGLPKDVDPLDARLATQVVHHSAEHPSRLRLYVAA
jgi:putative CocE/NonD family hydrolase